MKPVGLADPRTGKRPHAVVQLRQDNALGTLWNMVGFQTKLKYAEQARVLRMIPGLAQGGVRASRRPASQHVPQFAEAARRDAATQSHAATALRRPDHGLRRLCRERRHRLAGRPVRGRRTSGPTRATPPPTLPHSAPCSTTSPAGTSSTTRSTKGQAALVPAHERQFRSFPADGPADPRRCRQPFKGKDKTFWKKRLMSRRALADLAHWLQEHAA